MLKIALILFLIAAIAWLFGFGGIAALSWDVGEIALVVGLVLLVIFAISRASRGRMPV